MNAQPIFVKLVCPSGSFAAIALQPPRPEMTIGVATARPMRIIRNWTISETWSAIIPPNVV